MAPVAKTQKKWKMEPRYAHVGRIGRIGRKGGKGTHRSHSFQMTRLRMADVLDRVYKTGKEKNAIGFLRRTQQTSQPTVAPVEPDNVVPNILDVSMASNNSTKSMDVSYGSNAGGLGDQPTEQQPRHEDAFAELRRIFLHYTINCFMTMFSFIITHEN